MADLKGALRQFGARDVLRVFGEALYIAGWFLAVLCLLLVAGTIGGMAAEVSGADWRQIPILLIMSGLFWLLGYGARHVVRRLSGKLP